MIISFVPCRLESSRLPNKAIQDIYGLPATERCLINTIAIPGVDKVILSTSSNKEDDKLLDYNPNGKVEIIKGPEDDALERFMPNIHSKNPDYIVRITGSILSETEMAKAYQFPNKKHHYNLI